MSILVPLIVCNYTNNEEFYETITLNENIKVINL